MAKNFEVTVVVPEGLVAGDEFTVTVAIPETPKKARGQLHGIALADMTDEQLKRELVNSKSVLYKAKQRNAPEEVVAANQARVDAALAEKASRAPAVAESVVEAPEGDVETIEEIVAEI